MGCAIKTTHFERGTMLLREMNKGDLPLVLAWRNNPLIYKGTYSQTEPISWEEHEEWWDSRNKDHHSFMVMLDRPIGVIHISLLDYWSPEIGIIMGEPKLWNKGYGTLTFELGCEWLKERGYKWTSTTVLGSNKAMERILQKLGFKHTCEGRDGERRYAKKL